VLSDFYGSLVLDIGSLDWVGDPGAVISEIVTTTANLDLSTLSVTYTDHSVRITIENTFLRDNTVVNVRLLTVPVPSPLPLTVLGLALVFLCTRMPQRHGCSLGY